MAATEIIGGVELSDYGLKLSSITGLLDLPKYKPVIDNNPMTAAVRVTEEKTVTIKLIGSYANTSALTTAIGNFQTKIKSAPKQLWSFFNYGFAEYCVVGDGMTVNIFGRGQKKVEITIKLSITTLT